MERSEEKIRRLGKTNWDDMVKKLVLSLAQMHYVKWLVVVEAHALKVY